MNVSASKLSGNFSSSNVINCYDLIPNNKMDIFPSLVNLSILSKAGLNLFIFCSYLYMQTASRSSDLLSNNSAWHLSLRYIIPADLFATATSLSRAIAEENWGRVAEIKHVWCFLVAQMYWLQVRCFFFLGWMTIYSFNITMSRSRRGQKSIIFHPKVK